jgi:hypothetical protein
MTDPVFFCPQVKKTNDASHWAYVFILEFSTIANSSYIYVSKPSFTEYINICDIVT